MIVIVCAPFYIIKLVLGWDYLGMYSMATPVFLPINLELTKLIMSKDFHHFVDRGMYYNEKVDPIGMFLERNQIRKYIK